MNVSCAACPARVLPVALLLLVLGACRSAPPPGSPGPRPRVVSLQPNATEILFALGAGPNVVGATRYCDRPEAARAVPRVGGILDVSLEAVLAARPDLVVGSAAVIKGRLADVLDAAGVRALPVVFETAADVEPGILAIGAAVGRTPEAEALAASYRADLQALAGRARRDPPRRVLLVVGRSPLVVAARTSYLGDLLERMGAQNVANGSMPYPTWSLEQVIRSSPEVVVDGAVEAGDLAALLADAGVPAALEGRVVRVRDEALLRPGPGTGRAALALADEIVRASPGVPSTGAAPANVVEP